jgi:hypothetical protein
VGENNQQLRAKTTTPQKRSAQANHRWIYFFVLI